VLTPAQARDAIDVPTIALLFGLMVVSAQFQLAGLYGRIAAALGASALPPARLLLAVIVVAGALSAVLVNDVVCLALAPLLVEVCARRGWRRCPSCSGWPARATSARRPRSSAIRRTSSSGRACSSPSPATCSTPPCPPRWACC
jgi:hypothetical protein